MDARSADDDDPAAEPAPPTAPLAIKSSLGIRVKETMRMATTKMMMMIDR